MRKIDSIVIHHTGTVYDTARTIKKYHTEIKGWSDIGYHYVIELDGTIAEGRPLLTKGAHCFKKNKNSIGVCIVGIKKFNPQQFQSLHRLLDLLCENHKIHKKNIFGHNEFSDKECPGFDVGLIREFI